MRERLLKFMEIEKLQASRLAEILGVQPATISHILNGRNKPSFEFIEKMLLRFPKINPEWFLLGKGPTYRPEVISTPISSQGQVPPTDLFAAGENPTHGTPDAVTGKIQTQAATGIKEPEPATVENKFPDKPRTVSELSNQETEIDRIVIFLKDGTCIAYKPQ